MRAPGDVTAIGALSEEEGMSLLRTLRRVDVVLIGGRYSDAQRHRIRSYVGEHLPSAQITEAGWDYPYENSAIVLEVGPRIDGARGRRA